MKRRFVAVIVWAALAATPGLRGQMLPIADRNPPPVRELSGAVLSRDDVPLANAIVYLKNTKTLAVKTFITAADGKYRFPALAPNADYEVYAEHQGKRSSTKTLSSFDSRREAFINLRIDTPR